MAGALWRVTRNPYGRALYEWLAARGLRASLLLEYRRPAAKVDTRPPDGVTILVQEPPAAAEPFRDAEFCEAADLVIEAREGGQRVGSALLTLGRAVSVPELGRTYDPGGGYVWRVHVASTERGRGIGSALVRAAVRTTAVHDVADVVALIARDNVPSKRAFEGVGFEPTVEHQYLNVLGRELARSVPH